MQKVVKYFNSLVFKTLLKHKNKTNIFFTNNSTISNFNKVLISFISLLFFYLFYLSIPTLYNKTWLQKTLESRLLEEFNINFSTSSEITYNILPSPHYIIKDSKIYKGSNDELKMLANIKKLKVFIFQTNFFNKDRVKIKRVLIDNANFPLKINDFKSFNELSNKKFSNKEIKVRNSNIFFKDNSEETVAIIKIPNAFLFYDHIDLLNILNLDGEIFNIPFVFSFNKKVFSSGNKKINIDAKKLKLNISNISAKNSKGHVSGLNTVSILNSKIHTLYDIKKDLINFYFDSSNIKNSNIDYNGNLSFQPFDLKLKLKIKEYNISKMQSVNSTMSELVKTKLLFNNNISANVSIDLDLKKNNIFDTARIYFKIMNGQINFNKSKLINDKIGLLELNNSNLFFEKNKLILNTNVEIKIKKPDNLYSLLRTSKKSRKPIKNILVNLDYDFLDNEINFNKVNIDGNENNVEIINLISDFEYNKDTNINKSRRLINKVFSIYEG